MADIALSAVQTLFAALQSSQVNEIFCIWGYKSQLKDLQGTVSTITKVLLDAEARERSLSFEERDYVEKLKDAVYDADDLFDEVVTIAELKQYGKGNKFSDKVRDFFSSKKSPLSVAYTTSKEVKKIKKRLEGIASDHVKFGFKFDSRPIRERREETCSYVYAPDIIGRENDKKAVISRLLDSEGKENVSFLTIVGVGGLGKTTLAQLVYHDDRVKCGFSLRLWVCVSDQDGEKFNVKTILSKILDSAGYKIETGSTKEWVQSRFQEKLGGRKCLLVIDDVWNENRYEWGKLRGFLMGLGVGSMVVATTRSRETARIIGDGNTHTYELGGLSKVNSWDLFELVAFGKSHEHLKTLELVEIGKAIVEQCSNVPLVIKVVGSLLFGQDKSKWQAFEKIGVAKVSRGGNEIMPILKLSYDNLESQLKSCFSYCAVFPKGFEIDKEMLVSLWMAQGYIKPFYEGQSMEAAGEEHFTVLLRRCFFQDVKVDRCGDVLSCKIHDLMHDVAQEIARKEITQASTIKNNLGNLKVRHLFADSLNCSIDNFGKSKLRSYLQLDRSYFGSKNHGTIVLDPLITNWSCLRALSLNNAPIVKLPDSISGLTHLRYLDMSKCKNLKVLSNSVTKVHNLQTLVLHDCGQLDEMPKDLSRLVNLRHLDISGCYRLSSMPSGMDKLTNLALLTDFYMAEGSVGQLKELKALRNLKGGIFINLPGTYSSAEESDQEGGYLANMPYIKRVTFFFRSSSFADEKRFVKDEAVMEKLQPHPNLRELSMLYFEGRIIPRWGRAKDNWADILPNLVHVQLSHCKGLQHLPSLSKLEHLRSLNLVCLDKVEYIEEEDTIPKGSFFPSLEYLRIENMVNLTGWWRRRRREGEDVTVDGTSSNRGRQQLPPPFARLSKLVIDNCPNLISFPSCPTVERLKLRKLNSRLRLITPTSDQSNLKVVKIQRVCDLQALPPWYPGIICICQWDLSNQWSVPDTAESFSGVREVLKTRGSSSAHCLKFESCKYHRDLSGGGFQRPTAPDSLDIFVSPKLILNCVDDSDGIRWTSLHHSVRSLQLRYLDKLESLPKGRGCSI